MNEETAMEGPGCNLGSEVECHSFKPGSNAPCRNFSRR